VWCQTGDWWLGCGSVNTRSDHIGKALLHPPELANPRNRRQGHDRQRQPEAQWVDEGSPAVGEAFRLRLIAQRQPSISRGTSTACCAEAFGDVRNGRIRAQATPMQVCLLRGIQVENVMSRQARANA
jgi:hypothetical protein